MAKNSDPLFTMSMYVNEKDLYKAKAEYYMKKAEKARKAFKAFYRAMGCGCCSDYDGQKKAEKKIAELLNFQPYSDGSGYDFYERDDDDQN